MAPQTDPVAQKDALENLLGNTVETLDAIVSDIEKKQVIKAIAISAIMTVLSVYGAIRLGMDIYASIL